MQRSGWLSLVLGLLILVAWELAATGLKLSTLVLPPPSLVMAALHQGFVSGYLGPHVLQTLLEVVLGFGLGSLLGFLGGVALGEWPGARRVLMPYLVVSQVVPKLALAPLLIVWLGFGATPTVVITALICFFPLLENTLTAMQHVDPQRLELFRMLRASRWQTIWRLKVPDGKPAILAGLRVAVVLAWVGAVVGEFIGASRGLGALIIAAQGSMDTPLMFAVLVVITVLGWASYQAMVVLERSLLK
jgi:NitT/TauT family transport system permease protein